MKNCWCKVIKETNGGMLNLGGAFEPNVQMTGSILYEGNVYTGLGLSIGLGLSLGLGLSSGLDLRFRFEFRFRFDFSNLNTAIVFHVSIIM